MRGDANRCLCLSQVKAGISILRHAAVHKREVRESSPRKHQQVMTTLLWSTTPYGVQSSSKQGSPNAAPSPALWFVQWGYWPVHRGQLIIELFQFAARILVGNSRDLSLNSWLPPGRRCLVLIGQEELEGGRVLGRMAWSISQDAPFKKIVAGISVPSRDICSYSLFFEDEKTRRLGCLYDASKTAADTYE